MTISRLRYGSPNRVDWIVTHSFGQIIINFSALRCLRALLENPRRAIRKETCWTLSNITAGNQAQIQAVVDEDIFPTLIRLLSTAEFDIQKEAAWAVSNATSGGTDEQIMHLVTLGRVLSRSVDVNVCSL